MAKIRTAVRCNTWQGRRMLSPFPVLLRGRAIVQTGTVCNSYREAQRAGVSLRRGFLLREEIESLQRKIDVLRTKMLSQQILSE